MGSSNDAAAAVQSDGGGDSAQAPIGSSPITGDTAGTAAGQQPYLSGQGNFSSVPGQGSGVQPQAGGNYTLPQAEGGYMQSQAPVGGGSYTQ